MLNDLFLNSKVEYANVYNGLSDSNVLSNITITGNEILRYFDVCWS